MNVEEKEIVYEAYTPWRRYFARSFDIAIYAIIWRIALMQIFSVNVFLWDAMPTVILDTVMIIALLLIFEPLMLWKLGTTPGKKILGLEVRSRTGNKLGYGEAFDRSFGVLSLGMGYNIPIYQLIRNYKSFQVLAEKKTVSWDKNIQYRVLDRKWYRILGLVIGYGLLIMIMLTSARFSAFPPNRGEITVSEYAENYNYLTNHYGLSDSNYYLDPRGSWKKRSTNSNDGTINIELYKSKLPIIKYELEGDHLKSIEFEIEAGPENKIIMAPLERLTLGTLAFVLADDTIKPWSFNSKDVLTPVNNSLFETYALHVGQTNISNEIEYEGFSGSNDGYLLLGDESVEDRFYYMKVQIKR